MKRNLLLIGAFFIIYLAWTWLYYALTPFEDPLVRLTALLPILAALMSGIYAFRYHGLKSAYGKSLLLFSMIPLFGLIGVAFLILQVFLGMGMFKALSVLAWQIPYPITLLAFYFVWKTASQPIGGRKVLILLASFVVITYGVAALALPFMISGDPQKISVMLFYVVESIQVLSCMVFAVISFHGGRLFRVWRFIFMSIVLIVVGNMINDNVTFNLNTAAELLFDASFLLLAFGFLYNRQIFEETVKDGKNMAVRKRSKGRLPARKRALNSYLK
jgi:hypothetical protein